MTDKLTISICALLLAFALPASANEKLTLSGPLEHKNITVYLVHGPEEWNDINIITLDEAMKSRKAEVTETGSVQRLQIENRDKTHFVFGLPGDIVKGGKQDRTLPNGFLLPPMSGTVPLNSFCVEQNRWSQRTGETVAYFSSSSKSLSSRNLKLACQVEKSQGAVWKTVASHQTRLSHACRGDVRSSVSTSSLQLALENKQLNQRIDEYVAALRRASNGKLDGAIGMAVVINGQFNGADLFGSSDLFVKLWPKLLRAAATEAIGDSRQARATVPVSREEIETILTNADSEKPKVEKLAMGGSIRRHEGEGFLAFDTVGQIGENDHRIHRNILAVSDEEKRRLMNPAPQILDLRLRVPQSGTGRLDR